MNTHRGTRPWADQPPGKQRPAIVPRPRFTDPGNAADEDWRKQAACGPGSGIDPETFYPIGSTGPALLQISDAKEVCTRCPVRVPCLRFALDAGIDSGVFGGTTEDERRSMKRRAARQRMRDAS